MILGDQLQNIKSLSKYGTNKLQHRPKHLIRILCDDRVERNKELFGVCLALSLHFTPFCCSVHTEFNSSF